MPKTLRPVRFPQGSRSSKAASPGQTTARFPTVEAFGPNPGDLTMKLVMPRNLPPEAPLVVVLHGCTQSAEAYAVGAGWLSLAERFGFALLCPEQRRSNNPNLCFNWFQPGDIRRGGGEAASIHAMVDWALATQALDPTRVFATGLSAGGAMTAVMLAAYPETFAGGAVIAGLPYGVAGSMQEAFGAMTQPPPRSDRAWGELVRSASPDTRAWPPISIWHGTADATVRPGVGEALLRQWLDVHEVRTGPTTRKTPQGRDYEAWFDADGRTVVEMHRVRGLAHGTPLQTGGPDGHGVAGPFLLEAGLSSSLEIARTWGIASGAGHALAAAETPSRDLPPPTAPAPPRPAPLPQGTGAIGSVIENALRAAGLMR